MLYFIHGHQTPADCTLLEDQTVAVVCISDSGGFGPDQSAQKISRAVGKLLAVNGDGIKVIHHSKVNKWLDNNDEGSTSYRRIGKDLKADMVLAIEISGYRLHEGQTMYKGRSGVELKLYDLEDGGEIVWEDTHPDYAYPANRVIHISEVSQARFEQMFVGQLSKKIAQHFYSYERIQDVASEATALHTE